MGYWEMIASSLKEAEKTRLFFNTAPLPIELSRLRAVIISMSAFRIILDPKVLYFMLDPALYYLIIDTRESSSQALHSAT